LTAVAAAALVLAACSGLTQSDKPAVNVWWLQPLAGAPRAQTAVAPTPLFLELEVVPGLDSDKILALSSDAQIKPYAGARWADDLPALAGSLVSRSLEASGHFQVVQHGRAAAAGCELRLEVSEFFADLEAGGRTRGVSVATEGQYRCGTAVAQALASRAYVGVSDERMSAIVAAFQQALDQVTQDIINNIYVKQ